MAKQEQIFQFIRTRLNPHIGERCDPRQNLLETGVLDSTAMIELFVWLESTFHVSIAVEDLVPENFATLDSMADYIERVSAAV